MNNVSKKPNALDPSTTEEVSKRLALAQQANAREITEMEQRNAIFRQIRDLEILREKLEKDGIHALSITKDSVKNEFAIQNGQITKDFEQLLEKDAVAYGYMSKELKNDEFTKKCMALNPSVYSYLSPEKQQDPSMVNSYMNSRMRNSQTMEIGAGHEKALVPQQIDKSVPQELAYENQKYKKAYEYVLKNGQYNQDHSYNNQYCYMLEYQKEMGQRKAIELSQEVLRENKDFVMQVASNESRLDERARDIIDVAKKVPEFEREIEERQRGFWEDREEKLLEIQLQKDLGQQIKQKEEVALNEAKLNLDYDKFEEKRKLALQLEVTQKLKKISEERKKQVQLANMAAMKNTMTDQANALQDRGVISIGEANEMIGRTESLPSITTLQHAYQVVEKINDMYHDHENEQDAQHLGGAVVSDQQREEEIDSLMHSISSGKFDKDDVDRLYELTDPEGYERYKEERDNGDYRYSGYADREIEREYNPNEKD